MSYEPISVAERLPDSDDPVIVYCRGGAYNQLRWLDIAYFSNGKWYLTSSDDENENDHVTHWYPIPKLQDAWE